MKNCDYVYHIAGVVSYNKIDDKEVYDVNYVGVKKILHAAKKLGVKKIVVTGSTAGIGIPEDKNKPLTEDDILDLKKYKKVMYMYSKHLCIKACKRFSDEGLNVSVVSPTTIYGQGDVAMHIGKVVKKIKENKLGFAPPGGNAVLSVDDVCDAHILVMEKGKSGENYIFADEFMTYLDMFNRIAVLVKSKKIKSTLPRWILSPVSGLLTFMEYLLLIFGKKPLLPVAGLRFSFQFRYFDSSKARKELCWKPKNSFEDAMKKAIEFYEKEGLI